LRTWRTGKIWTNSTAKWIHPIGHESIRRIQIEANAQSWLLSVPKKKLEMVQLITDLEVDFTHSILSLLRLQLASWHQAWLLNLDHGELWYHPYLSGWRETLGRTYPAGLVGPSKALNILHENGSTSAKTKRMFLWKRDIRRKLIMQKIRTNLQMSGGRLIFKQT
jgi:hypothetical protein